MAPTAHGTALIVGAGPDLSASLARRLSAIGWQLALAAPDLGKLGDIAHETSALTFNCDASRAGQVDRLFDGVENALGLPSLVIFNAGGRVRGPLVDLDAAAVERTLAVTAFGGFLAGQGVERATLKRGSGTILFTGASASVKGYAGSAAFAMGKFALRGLAQSLFENALCRRSGAPFCASGTHGQEAAPLRFSTVYAGVCRAGAALSLGTPHSQTGSQSMARELGPRNIHVAHVVIDGAIRSADRREPADAPDSLLDPEAIADAYLHLIAQPRTAWMDEIAVRPWVERF